VLAFDMPLAKAWIVLFEEGSLLSTQRDRLFGIVPLERQPALLPGAELVLV
jgi:hypothetical protein